MIGVTCPLDCLSLIFVLSSCWKMKHTPVSFPLYTQSATEDIIWVEIEVSQYRDVTADSFLIERDRVFSVCSPRHCFLMCTDYQSLTITLTSAVEAEDILGRTHLQSPLHSLCYKFTNTGAGMRPFPITHVNQTHNNTHYIVHEKSQHEL